MSAQRRKKRVYRRFSDEAVEQAVVVVWDVFHRVCGTRLIPLIRANLRTLVAEFKLLREVQTKLARGIRSTVERMLGRERKLRKPGGKGATKPGTLLYVEPRPNLDQLERNESRWYSESAS
ncbi:MAG: hypothetical protein LBD79_07955 [Treponema sp.]|nr:hypothetical protein [Treponema sp.]